MAEPWSAVRLIQLGQPVDKIHDLAALSRQLEAVDGQWSWDAEDLSDLSSGAVPCSLHRL